MEYSLIFRVGFHEDGGRRGEGLWGKFDDLVEPEFIGEVCDFSFRHVGIYVCIRKKEKRKLRRKRNARYLRWTGEWSTFTYLRNSHNKEQ
jgi:hypothetical protein